MRQGSPAGVHRPRPWGTGLVSSSFALVAVVSLSVLLWAAAGSQLSAAIQASHAPEVAAQVVSCPQPGGRETCVVRLTGAAPGGQVDTSTAIAFLRTGLLAPDPSDTVSVTFSQDGAATLTGGLASANLALALVLAGVLTGWSVRCWQRVLMASTPVARRAGVWPYDAHDPRKGRPERHVA